jgi:hypothetical protein
MIIISHIIIIIWKSPANPHWAHVAGYGPFSLCVIHKKGLYPTSGGIKRLMMMMKQIEWLRVDIIIINLLMTPARHRFSTWKGTHKDNGLIAYSRELDQRLMCFSKQGRTFFSRIIHTTLTHSLCSIAKIYTGIPPIDVNFFAARKKLKLPRNLIYNGRNINII